ncbi:glycosyltransferase family 2 protein [Ectopseudomonas khazarica]|uniref:glycosyltransferase family 2 protein n=1 Tax=Ectopseudomonas khazarica TaxID=2502979 RepID=UPI001AF01B35|nr:glycosyltransferase family 2 protein [Pseudomonas khazarica]QTS87169.1 glycosyltransferase family 2 protein [Pseudomonas khazarica]
MKIAVVIPCYKVRSHVLQVLEAIPDTVERVYAVDDCCPDHSGDFIESHCQDPRVRVLRNPVNLGVGGAVINGYREALKDDMDIIVKVDGDGQMDPRLIPYFARPITRGRADYTKGNRFYRHESLRGMPKVRLIGNALLSFLTKLSCGYWSLMDPTNGYTAIHAQVLRELPLDKLETRYFFETDMLFRLNTVRAVVRDIPMDALYADEVSGLNVRKILPEFARKHLSRLARRYVYNYWLRDFNIGSLYSLMGSLLVVAGGLFGLGHWLSSVIQQTPATSGTVMLASLPILVGTQLLIAFLHHDISSTPQDPLHPQLTPHPVSP